VPIQRKDNSAPQASKRVVSVVENHVGLVAVAVVKIAQEVRKLAAYLTLRPVEGNATAETCRSV